MWAGWKAMKHKSRKAGPAKSPPPSTHVVTVLTGSQTVQRGELQRSYPTTREFILMAQATRRPTGAGHGLVAP